MQAGNIKVIVIELATLLAPHVHHVWRTVLRVARPVLDPVSRAVLAVVGGCRGVAVPLRGLDSAATRQAALAPGTPLTPATVHGSEGVSVPGHAFRLLAPLVRAMSTARSSIGPGHGLGAAAFVWLIARRNAPQRAALGLVGDWMRIR